MQVVVFLFLAMISMAYVAGHLSSNKLQSLSLSVRGGAVHIPTTSSVNQRNTNGEKSQRNHHNKNLPWSVMFKSFWVSLIDPGREAKIVREGEQKQKEQRWKSYRRKSGWLGKK